MPHLNKDGEFITLFDSAGQAAVIESPGERTDFRVIGRHLTRSGTRTKPSDAVDCTGEASEHQEVLDWRLVNN